MTKTSKYILTIAIACICFNIYAQTSRTVLIEGVGGALATNILGPAIIKSGVMNNFNYKVNFYGSEINGNALSENANQSIEKLTNLGMHFIDKSNPQDLQAYRQLTPDYVFLATPPNTHIPLVKMWLQRKYLPNKIIVEKPFTENLAEFKEFIEFLNKHPDLKDKVRAFDFAEIACGLYGERLQQITNHLGSIDEIVVYWLQNNSGEILDDSRLLSHDNRPISRENRAPLLQEGMVFDGLIHLFPAIHNVVDLQHIEVTDIKAAKYENAEIRGETFVAARMLLTNRQTNIKIPVTVYVGKGVGEISSLKIKRNLKHLILLHNKSGRRVMINLDESNGVYLDKEGNSVGTFATPRNYHAVIENLFLRDAAMGEPVESALQYLTVAEDIKNKIDTYAKTKNLPSYKVGTKSSPAPSLEEILSITRVYGKDTDKLRNVSIDYTG